MILEGRLKAPEYKIDVPYINAFNDYFVGEAKDFDFNLDTGKAHEHVPNDPNWVKRELYIAHWVNNGWDLVQCAPNIESTSKWNRYEYIWVRRVEDTHHQRMARYITTINKLR